MNILILGNGFDIYHKLPTRYTDFLFLVKNWKKFYKSYLDHINGYTEEASSDEYLHVRLDQNGRITQDTLSDYINNCRLLEGNRLERFDALVRDNLWINYFLSINYTKEGWIDFEKEMESVLLNIEKFFSDYLPVMANKNYETVLDPSCLSVFRFLKEHTHFIDSESGLGLYEYEVKDLMYGDAKISLLKLLKESMDELIEALDIFFDEFIEKLSVNFRAEQVRKIEDPHVLCFNYTQSYVLLYNNLFDNEKYHAIHGSSRNGDLVLGISDSSFDVLDYVYFQKYFQRIQKRTGTKYLTWLEKEEVWGKIPAHVYVFGHSLGKTDQGILDDFFKNEEGVKRITIFYHCQQAYEELVIALIAMYGKDFVIEQTGKQRIVFELLKDPIEIETRE